MDRWTEWDEDGFEVVVTSAWRTAVTVVLLVTFALAVCQPQPAKVPERRDHGAASGARATLGRLERGEGFALVPLTDADAYALEAAVGSDVVVEVER